MRAFSRTWIIGKADISVTDGAGHTQQGIEVLKKPGSDPGKLANTERASLLDALRMKYPLSEKVIRRPMAEKQLVVPYKKRWYNSYMER